MTRALTKPSDKYTDVSANNDQIIWIGGGNGVDHG